MKYDFKYLQMGAFWFLIGLFFACIGFHIIALVFGVMGCFRLVHFIESGRNK
jgi:hypothetical protein